MAGRTHRARLEPVTDAMGRPNYDLVVQTDGREAWRERAIYPSDGIKGRDRTDPNRFFVFTRSRFADVVSIDGKPVTKESIGHLRLVDPSRFNPGSTTERTFYVAVFRVPQPVGETGPYGPKGWVVQHVGGEPHDINE
ncbi:hypothetical protein ACOCJ5_02820 [Knoellia sp. CPCC 206450]|uniref:hypothetical protein n=1 Tax=Knoellia tibetensis TaxID=3404798 RepID=UPI003B43C675